MQESSQFNKNKFKFQNKVSSVAWEKMDFN